MDHSKVDTQSSENSRSSDEQNFAFDYVGSGFKLKKVFCVEWRYYLVIVTEHHFLSTVACNSAPEIGCDFEFDKNIKQYSYGHNAIKRSRIKSPQFWFWLRGREIRWYEYREYFCNQWQSLTKLITFKHTFVLELALRNLGHTITKKSQVLCYTKKSQVKSIRYTHFPVCWLNETGVIV